MTLMLHNYRSRQFHRTSNGINPCRGFKDMCSATSGPSAAWFDKFLAHGQAHIGQMGKWPWQCTTRGLDNSTELQMEKIPQAVIEIRVPQVWQPPARTVTTIPSSPEGWGVKGDTGINMLTIPYSGSRQLGVMCIMFYQVVSHMDCMNQHFIATNARIRTITECPERNKTDKHQDRGSHIISDKQKFLLW